MKKIYRFFITALMAAPLLSCGGGGGTKAESDTTDVKTESTPEVVEYARLNDTIYPSVDKVWYQIETVDKEVSGRLESVKDLYEGDESVLTFRKTGLRQANMGGRVDSVPHVLHVDWTVDTDYDRDDFKMGPWGGGSGWTGQPLYVVWPDSVAKKLTDAGVVNENFEGKEVILGSLCGKVYFLNPDSGKETRRPIPVGNTIKGTVSLDPTFNGLLYVGHGTPAKRPFGAVVVDLFKNEVTGVFPEDPKALRRWGAYDSSAIRVGQFLFRPAENGGIYKFLVTNDGLKLHSVLRYKVNGSAPGIESSMAVYANYGFVVDNHGNFMAINLDNMTPVWYYDLGDDIDATPVVMIEDGVPYVYTGCEVDLKARGYAVFAKINGIDGSEVWRIEPEGRRKEIGAKHFDGGFYATPLPGRGDAEGLIFTNLVKNTSGSNGVFMAIDCKTGKVAYELPLKWYAWSSPVGFLTDSGKQIVVTADCNGNVYMIDGKAGKIITTEHIGNNFESSPVVIGNSLIVGSRGNGIHKITLK